MRGITEKRFHHTLLLLMQHEFLEETRESNKCLYRTKVCNVHTHTHTHIQLKGSTLGLDRLVGLDLHVLEADRESHHETRPRTTFSSSKMRTPKRERSRKRKRRETSSGKKSSSPQPSETEYAVEAILSYRVNSFSQSPSEVNIFFSLFSLSL